MHILGLSCPSEPLLLKVGNTYLIITLRYFKLPTLHNSKLNSRMRSSHSFALSISHCIPVALLAP